MKQLHRPTPRPRPAAPRRIAIAAPALAALLALPSCKAIGDTAAMAVGATRSVTNAVLSPIGHAASTVTGGLR